MRTAESLSERILDLIPSSVPGTRLRVYLRQAIYCAELGFLETCIDDLRLATNLAATESPEIVSELFSIRSSVR